MKTTTLIIVIFCAFISAHAQELTSTRYWVKKGDDTVYCKKVKPGGLLPGVRIKYTTAQGQKVKISGSKACKEIPSFGTGSTTFDLLPLNPSHPWRQRYMSRYVDGAVTVNFYVQGSGTSGYRYDNTSYSGTTGSAGGYSNSHYYGGSSRTLYYAKINNVYYKFTYTTKRNTIVPFLKECERVRVNYEDQKFFKYSTDLVLDMIKVYNAECAPTVK